MGLNKKVNEITSFTISEYISELEKLKDKFGDLPIFNSSDSGEYSIDAEYFEFAEVKEPQDKENDWYDDFEITIERYPKRIVL